MWHPYLESDFTWLLQPVSGRRMLLQVAVSVTTPKKRGPKRNHSNCGWRDSKECVHDCPVFVYNVLRDDIVGSPALCTFHPHDSTKRWDQTTRCCNCTQSTLGVLFATIYIRLDVLHYIHSHFKHLTTLIRISKVSGTKAAQFCWSNITTEYAVAAF